MVPVALVAIVVIASIRHLSVAVPIPRILVISLADASRTRLARGISIPVSIARRGGVAFRICGAIVVVGTSLVRTTAFVAVAGRVAVAGVRGAVSVTGIGRLRRVLLRASLSFTPIVRSAALVCESGSRQRQRKKQNCHKSK